MGGVGEGSGIWTIDLPQGSTDWGIKTFCDHLNDSLWFVIDRINRMFSWRKNEKNCSPSAQSWSSELFAVFSFESSTWKWRKAALLFRSFGEVTSKERNTRGSVIGIICSLMFFVYDYTIPRSPSKRDACSVCANTGKNLSEQSREPNYT